MSKKRTRDTLLTLWVTEQEKAFILKKMEAFHSYSLSAYIRKMAMDGYIINIETKPFIELVSLVRHNSNNINQVAKVCNDTDSVYKEDMEKLKQAQESILASITILMKQLKIS